MRGEKEILEVKLGEVGEDMTPFTLALRKRIVGTSPIANTSSLSTFPCIDFIMLCET